MWIQNGRPRLCLASISKWALRFDSRWCGHEYGRSRMGDAEMSFTHVFAFSGVTRLRTSRYHEVDSLHPRNFSNSALLFLTVHIIGILEHSRALRGECTKWLVKKSLPQIFCFRSLFLTFFHFELLIFCWLFFLVSNRQKFYCCLFPRDKNVFKVNAHWVIFHK